MQIMVVVGKQPPRVVTDGKERAQAAMSREGFAAGEDGLVLDDPRSDDSRDRAEDPRDIDARDREPSDPRDVFMRNLDLPRGHERDRVHDRDRDREYTLRESRRARCPPSARFALCRRETFAITTGAHLIRSRAISDTYASRGSSGRFQWKAARRSRSS